MCDRTKAETSVSNRSIIREKIMTSEEKKIEQIRRRTSYNFWIQLYYLSIRHPDPFHLLYSLFDLLDLNHKFGSRMMADYNWESLNQFKEDFSSGLTPNKVCIEGEQGKENNPKPKLSKFLEAFLREDSYYKLQGESQHSPVPHFEGNKDFEMRFDWLFDNIKIEVKEGAILIF